MKQDDGLISGVTTVSSMICECRMKGQDSSWWGKAADNSATERNGPKRPLTSCEVEAFLLLAAGDQISALDHESGEVWRGLVDTPFPELGFVWVITDLGERKLLDIALHTISRPDKRPVCGNESQEQGEGLILSNRKRISPKM